jgi:hypothetical protein
LPACSIYLQWRNILAEAEVTTAAKLAEVEALLQVQVG